MGRVRRVAHYYNSTNRRDWSFADRTVANTQVQGLAADIMRYVLVRIYREVLLNEQYKDQVHFMASMHDELVFSVTKDMARFTEIVKKIQGIMTELPFPQWRKQLEVDLSVGDTWGSLYGFRWDNDKWQPNI